MTTNFMRTAALACVLLLAGCGGDELSRQFGFTRTSPDEFEVTTRAPLSMPPDLSLRPPQPGAARPQEQTATERAEFALVPQSALGAGGPADSPGQNALLQAAGPRPPADIRGRVDQDAARSSDNQLMTDKLIFWKNPPPLGIAVDPQKEAQRLRENAALGQQPDTGDTPIIQRKSRNFIDTLF